MFFKNTTFVVESCSKKRLTAVDSNDVKTTNKHTHNTTILTTSLKARTTTRVRETGYFGFQSQFKFLPHSKSIFIGKIAREESEK